MTSCQSTVHANFGRFNERSGYQPPIARIGGFPKDESPFGLLDMAGNVEEWCLDRYDPGYYGRAFPSNPFGPIPILARGRDYIQRGLHWKTRQHIDTGIATRRDHAEWNQAYSMFGLRLVREPDLLSKP